MTTFRLGVHFQSNEIMVDILSDDGALIGSIYPGNGLIHIVSKYFDEIPIEQTTTTIPVPGYVVKFRERR